MIRYLSAVAAVAAFALAPCRMVYAQQAPVPAPAASPAAPAAPQPVAKDAPLLRVQVVISRYQGEKKISSQPYMLSVSANGARATLKMGTQVPVPTGPVVSNAEGKPVPPSYNYRTVGATIECTARSLDDGRFRLDLTLDDSSVVADDSAAQPFTKGLPQFRSFQIVGAAVLRDGQSAQLTTAAEKVTGDVVKVDVTINVVK